jgi:hypothetical protein
VKTVGKNKKYTVIGIKMVTVNRNSKIYILYGFANNCIQIA